MLLRTAVSNSNRVLFAQFDSSIPGDGHAVLQLRFWELNRSATAALEEQGPEWYVARHHQPYAQLQNLLLRRRSSLIKGNVWTSINGATFISSSWPNVNDVPIPVGALESAAGKLAGRVLP